VFPSTALPRTIPANKCSPTNLRPNYSPEFTSPDGDSAYRTSRRTILCFPIRASLTTTHESRTHCYENFPHVELPEGYSSLGPTSVQGRRMQPCRALSLP
jgi:hypothetical protein